MVYPCTREGKTPVRRNISETPPSPSVAVQPPLAAVESSPLAVVQSLLPAAVQLSPPATVQLSPSATEQPSPPAAEQPPPPAANVQHQYIDQKHVPNMLDQINTRI